MSQEMKIIDFMRVRKLTSGISVFLVLASILLISINGLKLGLDFTGGTQLEVLFDRPADLGKVRDLLQAEDLESPVAVLFGSEQEVMIRTQDEMKKKGREALVEQLSGVDAKAALVGVERPQLGQESFAEVLVISGASAQSLQQKNLFPEQAYGRVDYTEQGGNVHVALEKSLDKVYVDKLIAKLEAATGAKIEIRSSEFVGPQIGDELRDDGGLGLLTAFLLVFIYVAIQFQWKFSVGAITALVHDVIITLGFFSLFQWDFDLTVLAAILALIGYSINDTIVIYDRIRENFRILRKMDPLEVVNISLTQTLGRSIMTSMTVMLVLLCLFLFGGELLRGFSSALIIGVFVGTYSSIYIAANITVALGIAKEDLMPRAKEGAEFDDMP
jgi:preprotein translocase subunit SecF